MNEDNLPTVAVIVKNLLEKSEKDFFNSHEQLYQTKVQNDICASLSCSSMFEKFSTVICLLLFFSINLLLYVFPIPY